MKYIICFLLFSILVSCKLDSPKKIKEDKANLSIIPSPDFVKIDGDSNIKELIFSLNESQSKYFEALNENSIQPIGVSRSDKPNLFFSNLNQASTPGHFIIEIEDSTIKILADDEEGKFNALSRLLQLGSVNKVFPIGIIGSAPKFRYRGMHLDVARHFFSVDDIKKYIDYLFFYGYNKFHWHLTEDQGWRIEIKQYPKLQEIAAFRDQTLIGHYNDKPQKYDGKKYGGFYTQKEIINVIKYASSKGIDVIPEIELPGHSSAALAAYPELGCEQKEYKVATKWGVFDDIYCPSEATFKFLENVLDEVIELFPSEYIHIGGDEAPKIAWQNSEFCQDLIAKERLIDEDGLQSYFIKRIEKYINSKGRSIIGWDEILEGGLAPNATVMSWRGMDGGLKAAEAGHNAIMTPTSHCYFDYYQSNHKKEPIAIGGFLPLKKVYSYDPIPSNLSEDKHKFILGAQGNVWTEYMPSFDKVEYMAIARMAALSEVLWKDKSQKDFKQFEAKLSKHIDFWNEMDVNIADHRLDIQPRVLTKFGEGSYVDFGKIQEGAKLQFVSPSQKLWSNEIESPFPLTENGYYSFRAVKGDLEGRSSPFIFENHLGTKASILLINPPSDTYQGLGSASLNNGILAPTDKYGGNEWLGFKGDDLEAEMIFPDHTDISSVNFRFFKGNDQWIYLPKSVEVFVSNDGKTYRSEKRIDNIKSRGTIASLKLNFKNLKTKYLKVKATNYGTIPKGQKGEGHRAWLFVDEVIVN